MAVIILLSFSQLFYQLKTLNFFNFFLFYKHLTLKSFLYIDIIHLLKGERVTKTCDQYKNHFLSISVVLGLHFEIHQARLVRLAVAVIVNVG